jgi:hypothetical protein
MSKYWFERDWKNDGGELDRRQAPNRLQRVARESQEQEEAQIPRWLELAKSLFDKDDDPDPQAA